MTIMDSPAVKRTLPAEVLTEEEVARLVKAVPLRTDDGKPRHAGYRNRALIVCLWRSGLRLSEALDLLPKDLDRKAGTVRVLHGKGDKSRVVGMDDAAFAEIDCWLLVRDNLGIGNRSPLFCTLEGARVATAYIRAELPRLAKRAGIEKRVHAHGLRHLHACELATEGVELRIISAQLGHGNISVTDRYLRHLAPTAVIEAMRGRNNWKDGEL